MLRMPLGLEVGGAVLILDGPCGTCRAAGVVPSPAWAEWIERYNAAEAALEAVKLDRATIVDGASQAAGDEPAELEEMPCPDCDGVGFRPTAAGASLLGFVRRYGA